MESVGRYLVCAEIASGGMATVHFGRLQGDAGFARTVAIKKLHPQLAKDPEFVAMLLDEAKISARVRHPNVVPTLDVVAANGQLLVVMDYVHGESVSRLLGALRGSGDRGGVPPRIAVAVMVDVLHGLQAAHEATSDEGAPLGIVHRDMSPQNVMVGVDGRARVVDFGVAKAAGRLQTTSEGQIKGKVAYMAAEQLRAQDVDGRTDVYAAAVVLWEMLVGARLFVADSAPGTVTLVLEKVVEPPSRFAPELPPSLDAIVLKALARNPADRYPDARAMATALEEAIAPASPATVGAWVQSVAAHALATRADQIRQLEGARSGSLPTSGSTAAAVAVDGSSAAAPARSARTSVALVLFVCSAVIAAVTVAAVAVVATARPRTSATVASAAPSDTASPSASASTSTSLSVDIDASAPQATESATATASAVPSTPLVIPSARPSTVRRPGAAPTGSPVSVKPAPARTCTPPYTLDKSGFHIPKPECL